MPLERTDKFLIVFSFKSPQRYPSSSTISVTPAPTPTSSTALLQYNEYVPRSASPSPYLSISMSPRRSSTSDILNKKTPSGTSSETPPKKQSQNLEGSSAALTADTLAVNSALRDRRPSTAELMRKARERKGSEGKLGRSMSSGGSLSRGANKNRRLSMAY